MILFVGPTLPAAEAAGFEVHPPAAQGDLYRAALRRPAAIGLLDGYFDARPAVWHKEILWALAEGIPVYGAASMGALRAAELAAFGMRGVGEIFAAYRDGRLVADDAVALLHGPPETGYVALSEPLVNIAATLARAGQQGIAAPAEVEALLARAGALHYPERTWERILGPTPTPRLAAWLPGGRVDQKRLDALEMLSAMRAAEPAAAPGWRLERTDLWREVAEHAGLELGLAATELEMLLDEIRLSPHLERLRWAALARRLLRRPAAVPAPDSRSVSALRQRLGLYRRDSYLAWLSEHRLSEGDFGRLAGEGAALLAGQDHHWVEALVDELRLSGDLGPLLARARDKRAALAACGREEGEAEDPAGGLPGLVAWHCARSGRAFPDDLDAHCAALGFPDRTIFRRALAREMMYSWLQDRSEQT